MIAAYRDLERKAWSAGCGVRPGAAWARERTRCAGRAAGAPLKKWLRVTREPAINPNYQREHRYNLWFVVTAASRAARRGGRRYRARHRGCAVIVLPLEEEFHIDLGFDPGASAGWRRRSRGRPPGERSRSAMRTTAASAGNRTPADRRAAGRLEA